jgi:Tfp pilus assembly protein PilX
MHRTQRGAALLTALILLVALTIISLASLGTSLLELRMANNTESGISAFQSAQSAIESIIHDGSANMIVAGVVGHTNCTTGLSCNENNVSLPEPFDNFGSIKITRTTDSSCPPRIPGSEVSCAWSKAAGFEINSKYDRSSLGQGQAELNQGYIKLYPTTPGGSSNEPETALHN